MGLKKIPRLKNECISRSNVATVFKCTYGVYPWSAEAAAENGLGCLAKAAAAAAAAAAG